MNVLSKIRKIATLTASTVVLLATVATADVTKAFEPSAEYLERWQTSLSSLRDMTPKWGVQPADAFKATLDAGVPIMMLDVRAPAEWAEGVIEGALLLNLNELPTADGLAKLPADRTAAIGVYCKSGHRSALALSFLHQLGYVNAINMAGGFEAWKKAEYPFVMPAQ